MRTLWVVLMLASVPAAAASRDAVGDAQALIRECKYDEAEKLIATELEKASADDRGVLLMAQGMVAEYRGDLSKAIALYKGVEGQTVPSQSLRYLGLALIRHKQFQDGFTALNTYLVNEVQRKKNPLERDVLALAVALAELGRLQDAGTLLDQAAVFLDTYNPLLPQLREAVTAARTSKAGAPAGTFWTLAYGTDDAAGVMSTDFTAMPRKRIAPHYPRGALRAGREARLFLEVSVDASGRVEDVKVLESSGGGDFSAAAIMAVKRWEYRPKVKQCQPVPFVAIQPIEFRMGR